MNPRLAAMAALFQEVAIPAFVLACIAALGAAGFDNTGAAPIVERHAPSAAAVARFADQLPPISLAAADAVAAGRSVMETAAAEATPASHQPEPIVTAALTDTSEMLPPETSPEQVARLPAAREPGDAHPAVDSTEVLDECLVVDRCIDRYLWLLYQRTPKEDAVKI